MIPDGYTLIATLSKMNGAWLLSMEEIWDRDEETGRESPKTVEGYEAWASVTKAKASLREGFGPLRYEGSEAKGLLWVYAKIDDLEQVDR